MRRLFANMLRWPINSLAGVLVGVVISTWLYFLAPEIIGPITRAWDEAHPVVTPISTEVLEREEDAVVVRIIAMKEMGEECVILRIYASAVGRDGLPELASVRRPNGDEHQQVSHERGIRDFGLWRIKPVEPGARSVTVYTEHACLGRVIKSKIAEVAL